MRKLFFCCVVAALTSSCSDNGRYVPVATQDFIFITDTQNGKVYYWSPDAYVNSVHTTENNVTPNYVDFITNAKEYKK